MPREDHTQLVLDISTPSRTTAAFFRWREARLKAHFKRQLQQILEEVSVEDHAAERLQHEVKKAHKREQDLLQKLSILKGEFSTTAEQLLDQQSLAADLQATLDSYDAQVLAPLAKRLTDAEDAQAAQLQRHQQAQEAQRQAFLDVKQEQLHLLTEHQQLLDTLAQKEQQIADLTAKASAATDAAASAEQKLSVVEGVLRTTAEQAAAAEDMSHSSNRTVIKLQEQLANLKDRYHAEMAHMAPLRAAAAESLALRGRLGEASASAAALAASRQELRTQLDKAHAALAAATERCRQLEGSAHCEDGADPGNDSLAAALAQQLEAAQGQLKQLAPRMAAAEVSVQQQQRHIQQLAGELQQAQAARAATQEHAEVLQVLNAKLQAGLRHQAALSDSQRLLEPAQLQGNCAAAATDTNGDCAVALLASHLQEQLDCLRNAERRMKHTASAKSHAAVAASITAKAAALLQDSMKHLTRNQQQQQLDPEVQAASVCSSLQELSQHRQQLQEHVVQELQQQLLRIQAEQRLWQETALPHLAVAGDALASAREACASAADDGGQVDAAVAAESASKQLADIAGQLAEALPSSSCTAATSSAFHDDSGACHWQQSPAAAREGKQHSALPQDAQSACAAAASAARRVCDALLEAAGQLKHTTQELAIDCEGSDVVQVLASSIVQADSTLKDSTKVISSAVAALGRQAADVAATLAQLQPVQAALSTAFDLLQQLEQQLLAIGSASCHNSTAMRQPGSSLQANAAAGTNMSDVAVLQLEAEALRLQLQRRTLEVHELKDRQQQLLSGNAGFVPADLLVAARIGQDDAQAQAACLMQQLKEQAAGQQEVAAMFVQRVAAQRQAALLHCTFLTWRLAAANGRGERLLLAIEATKAQLDHTQHCCTARSCALRVFFKHQAKARAAAAQQQQAAAVLSAWQRQLLRQQRATWAWRELAEQLLVLRQRPGLPCRRCQCLQTSGVEMGAPGNAAPAGANSSSMSPNLGTGSQRSGGTAGESKAAAGNSTAHGCGCSHAPSFMQRLLQHRGAVASANAWGQCRATVAAGKLLAAAFRAWHMLAQLQGRIKTVQQAEAQMEGVSAGLPAWIAQLGDKRRLERAWLGWRLAAVRTARQRWPQQQAQAPTGLVLAHGGSSFGAAAAAAGDVALQGAWELPLAVQEQVTHPQQQQQQQHATAGRFVGLPRWQINTSAVPSSAGGVCAGLQELPARATVAAHARVHALSEVGFLDTQQFSNEVLQQARADAPVMAPQALLPLPPAANSAVTAPEQEEAAKTPCMPLPCGPDSLWQQYVAPELSSTFDTLLLQQPQDAQQQQGTTSWPVCTPAVLVPSPAAADAAAAGAPDGRTTHATANDKQPGDTQQLHKQSQQKQKLQQPRHQKQPIKTTQAQPGRPASTQHEKQQVKQQQHQKLSLRSNKTAAVSVKNGHSKQAVPQTPGAATRQLAAASASGTAAASGSAQKACSAWMRNQKAAAALPRAHSSPSPATAAHNVEERGSSPPPRLGSAAAAAAAAAAADAPASTSSPALDDYGLEQQQHSLAAAAAAASRVCGSFAGIATNLSALRSQVRQHTVAVAAGGSLGIQHGPIVEPSTVQSTAAAAGSPGRACRSPQRTEWGRNSTSKRTSKRTTSPVKLLAADVQTQLADYQQRLVHLQHNLHVAARPWWSAGEQDMTAGAGLAWRQETAAVLVRPQSPEAISLFGRLALAGGGQAQVAGAAAASTVVAAACSPEWRVVGQPRKSSLLAAVVDHAGGNGVPETLAAAGCEGGDTFLQHQGGGEPGVIKFSRLC